MAQQLRICLECKRYQSGEIPHASEQLSPCATAIEPVPQSPCCPTSEATAMRSSCATTRGSSWAATKSQCRKKKKEKVIAKSKMRL